MPEDNQSSDSNPKRDGRAGQLELMKPLVLLLPSLLAMAWLVSKAQWYWNHRPDLQFGWGLLLICAYLFWSAWETHPPLRCHWTWYGAIAGVVGLGLLFLNQIYQAAFGMMPASLMGLAIAVMLIVCANLIYVFGWVGLWHFGFSYAFLLISLPLPSALQNPLVGTLQSWVASINVVVLNLSGIPAQKVGSLIQLSQCTVGIDEACSGIRSLQSSMMIALFVAYQYFRVRWVQVALVISGVGLALLGNIIRSLFLSFKADQQGVRAIDTYHDAAGWSILVFTFAGVALAAWVFKKIESQLTDEEVNPSDTTNSEDVVHH
jgi:exosortase